MYAVLPLFPQQRTMWCLMAQHVASVILSDLVHSLRRFASCRTDYGWPSDPEKDPKRVWGPFASRPCGWPTAARLWVCVLSFVPVGEPFFVFLCL